MATRITKKPSLAVTNLGAPVRQSNSRTMKATWKVPANLTNTNKNNRATGLEIDWFLGIPGADPKKVVTTANERLTTTSINLNSLKIGRTTYTRNSFYPVHRTRKLSYVTVQVVPTNNKGKGKVAKAQRKFEVPRAPSIDAISFNTETGRVSTIIRTNAGTDHRERYDTRYIVNVENTRTGRKWNSSDSQSTSTEFSVGYDVSDYQQLSYDEYVKVTVTAWARGYAGDSKKVSRTYYVSYPAKATIDGIEVSGTTSADKCTVKIKTNSTAQHPVDVVRLDYLANSDYSSASRIPADASWTESNIVDNASCNALAIPVANVMPDRGKYTWVRITSWHASEDVLYRYSDYKNVDALEVAAPTAADDEITILSATAGAGGTSAIVHLGWNADGQDDSTGTELSWSEDEDAWRSTSEPSDYRFEWSDGEVTVGGITYHDSATIAIKGLVEGQTYYIKARRYLEGDTTTYSLYSNAATLITSTRPASIVAVTDRFVSVGSSLPVRWTFSGSSLQTSWQIVDDRENEYTLTSDEEVVADKTYYERSGEGTEASPYVYTVVTNPQDRVEDIATWYELTYQSGTIIASGEGSVGSTQIDVGRLLDFAKNNVITFTVQASTGSGFVVSEPQTVTVIERPTMSITAPDTLTVQPYSFSVTASSLCDLVVIVTSQGASGQFPQGFRMQADGDTIHSDLYAPEWTENNGTFTATITLPTGLDFWDLGEYSLSVVAVDRTTGLRSDEAVANFAIAWARKAANPVNAVTLTVIDTTDDDGDHRQAVQIDLVPPADSYVLSTDTEVADGKTYYSRTGSGTEESPYVFEAVVPETGDNPTSEGWYELSNDVYDIYRMDVENPSLIGEGFPLTHTTVDEYAPFGDEVDLNYRIALRTSDGDVEFADVGYQAQCEHMRFDWSGGFIELPYGNTMGDSFKKDSEIRQHLDGGIDAYWNQNVRRTSSLHSEIIKILQPRDVERARLLARYAGAVFVRLPNGSAFEADVQVTDLSKKNDEVVSIAIDATEIGLTQEFLLPIPFVLEGGE